MSNSGSGREFWRFSVRDREKKLFEDMFSRYYRIINLPKYLPADQVFFSRFKRGVLKIVIDDDYIIHNKDKEGPVYKNSNKKRDQKFQHIYDTKRITNHIWCLVKLSFKLFYLDL